MGFLKSKTKNLVSYFKLRNQMGTDSSNPLEKIYQFHDEVLKMGIAPDFKVNYAPGTSPEAIFNGKKVLMFSSNDYLGLSMNTEVIEEAKKELNKHGIGPGGSRFLCGNVDLLEKLDKKTAEFVQTEDAITFPTGYMANSGVFQAVLDPFFGSLPFPKAAGIIFSDEYNHGSLVEGCRLSYAKKVIFRHNDVTDLKRKLVEHNDRFPKMIVTEGVFTPHGDISPLHDIVKLSKQFNAVLMVDDAHGVGVLGKSGGGTIQYLGLQGQVDIIMGSFDKALGGMGGFLAGNKRLIDHFRISSRPYMLSSSVPSVMAGGLIKSMDVCMKDSEGRTRLFKNAKAIRHSLISIGFKIIGSDEVPVVLAYIGDEVKSIEFSNKIFDKGIYCPSFRWPVVPEGASRMRITPMSTHNQGHIDALVKVFKEVGEEMGII